MWWACPSNACARSWIPGLGEPRQPAARLRRPRIPPLRDGVPASFDVSEIDFENRPGRVSGIRGFGMMVGLEVNRAWGGVEPRV